MGEGQSKQGAKPVYNKQIDRFELDVCIQQIKYTAEIQQNRRKGEANAKEKDLKVLITKDKKDRDRVAEFEKARSIANDRKIIKAFGYVQTYVGILKDHQMDIQNSKGDPAKIKELVPFVESILWGCQKLNMNCVDKFTAFLNTSFGSLTVGELSKAVNVLPEIKECFSTLNPTDEETKHFLLDFINRNSIDLEVLNLLGHNIIVDDRGQLSVEDCSVKVKIITTTQNYPGGGPTGPSGGFPGYPPYGGPGGPGGFPGYPPYGYPQGPGGFPPGPGYYPPPYQAGPGYYPPPYDPHYGQMGLEQQKSPTSPQPYPGFDDVKMLQPQQGGYPHTKGGNDSYDEFTMRMKNIKEGL